MNWIKKQLDAGFKDVTVDFSVMEVYRVFVDGYADDKENVFKTKDEAMEYCLNAMKNVIKNKNKEIAELKEYNNSLLNEIELADIELHEQDEIIEKLGA